MSDVINTQVGGDQNDNAPDNVQGNQNIDNKTGDNDKDTKGKELFDKGYAQGLKAVAKKFGFETIEQFEEAFNKKNTDTNEDESEIQKLTRQIEELQNRYKEQEKKAKELEIEKIKTSILAQLKEEYGFTLPGFVNVEGEDEEAITANARKLYDAAKAWKEEIGVQSAPIGVGAPTRPAQTAQITLEQFKKMNPQQKGELFRSNPDLFKQLSSQI